MSYNDLKHEVLYKGKAIIEEQEPEKPVKMNVLEQISLDEELARKIFEEEQAELEKRQNEKAAQEQATLNAVNKEWDNIQAVMDEDYELAASFDEVQKLFEKHMKWINSFVPIEEDLPIEKVQRVERSEKITESSKAEGSRKRACDKLDSDKPIDVESLYTIYPIVDWKSKVYGNLNGEDIMRYHIIRADGSFKRFESTSPEGYGRLLWGDFITMFNPNTVIIHMLIEKRYPLSQSMLSQITNTRLEVNHECEMAYELLRFTNLREDCWVLNAVEVTAASSED
ncbi:hypothetical protein Tco_0433202 [Tanacetum coccineum]